MAKMNTAQIMEKVATLLPQLNEEGIKIAQYNLNSYMKNPKGITAKEAKELYFDLYDNYVGEDEVEWEEDEVEMGLSKAMENSLKPKTKEEIAAEKIVQIMDSSNKPKENKLKSKKQQESKVVPPVDKKKMANKQKEVVYDKAPTEDQIVELVGYRYSYPKFPMEFNCKALGGKRLYNREDIKTLKDFKDIEAKAYDVNQQDDNFVIAVYVKENDIVDSRTYDYLNLYPNQSFKTMLKPFGVEHFPQELDILKIVHISDKVLVAVSMYTQIPYMFTHNRFTNNNTLHCRANFMGLDFQIYQVEQ